MDAMGIAERNAEEYRNRMRADFPYCAQMVDELREAGFSPRVRYARQGDATIGKVGPQGISPCIALPAKKKRA